MSPGHRKAVDCWASKAGGLLGEQWHAAAWEAPVGTVWGGCGVLWARLSDASVCRLPICSACTQNLGCKWQGHTQEGASMGLGLGLR